MAQDFRDDARRGTGASVGGERRGSATIHEIDRAPAVNGPWTPINTQTAPAFGLIEYFGNWNLIERTEEDIYRYCETAGVSRGNVTIRRDETGLALLVEVAKLE